MTRRRAIRLSVVAALCLLLGAVTTVGVAWWFGRPVRAENGNESVRTVRGPKLERGSPARTVWFHRATVGSEWEFDTIGIVATGGWSESIMTSGWPMLAMRSVERGTLDFVRSTTVPAWQFVSWEEGLAAPRSWQGLHTRLSMKPLLPGFAIDTALYAAAWWLLLFTPLPLYRTARRRLRVSRGMCGPCGYDLKGSPGGACPECGNTAGVKA